MNVRPDLIASRSGPSPEDVAHPSGPDASRPEPPQPRELRILLLEDNAPHA